MLRKIKKTDIWQFLRFCIVGTSNAVIDFGVLNLLLWLYPTADAWKILGYNSVAVLLASTNSFFWNKYWTFQRRNPITFQETYRFIVVAGGTMLMNDTLMWLLGRAFPGITGSSLMGANVLKLGAIIGTMSISFFGMRLWVFFQHRFAGEAQSLANYETERLPAIKLMYDVDTVIAGALKSVHNTSISLELTAATEFHPHSATSSVSPTIVPITYLPINTPVIAMQNERSYGGSISTTQVKGRTSLPITPLPESKPPRSIRSIKLESLG